MICLIVATSVSTYSVGFSTDNRVVTNPRLHVYPRYRNEMDAGELADAIHERLGFKLKADFEGDQVDGSVTVNSTNVIIEFYHDIKLTPEQKAELKEIVQSHHSKSLERFLKQRVEELNNESNIENSILRSDPKFGEAHETSWVSTTSTSWVSLDLEIDPFDVSGLTNGYHLFAWLSVEAKNTQGRIDFRIVRGLALSKTTPVYDTACPIDIYYFGKDPSDEYWIRTLHGYALNQGWYFGWLFVRAEWRVGSGTGYALYRIISAIVFER